MRLPCLVAFLAGKAIGLSQESFGIENLPRTFWEFLMWGLIAVCGWCWTAFMLSSGMRYLDHDSKALHYGQATILPFFVIHQPVILAIAYFVVQWEAAIPVKLLVIALGAFVVSIGLCELIIKRVSILRVMFGMKAGQLVKAQVAAGWHPSTNMR
jgi:hypothetical protein